MSIFAVLATKALFDQLQERADKCKALKTPHDLRKTVTTVSPPRFDKRREPQTVEYDLWVIWTDADTKVAVSEPYSVWVARRRAIFKILRLQSNWCFEWRQYQRQIEGVNYPSMQDEDIELLDRALKLLKE